jgi:hypothetical protein
LQDYYLFHLFSLHLRFLIFLACLTLPQRMRCSRRCRVVMMMVVVMRGYMQ